MSIRTTIDIPDELYSTLRQRAAQDHVSIRSLVISSIEDKFQAKPRSVPMLRAPVQAKGPRGPLCPDTENPYDLIFS